MADRYLVSGGSGLWNNTNNWSDSDGGASGASFPTSADNVFFTSNSANAPITTNVASAALSLTVSGTYAGTLTLTNNLTISGAMVLTTGIVFSGSANIILDTTATHTSATKVIPNLTFQGTATHTLSDDFNITNLTVGASTLSTTVNGGTIYVTGNYTVGGTTGNVLGTSTVVMTGTGTISMSAKTTGTQRLLIIIDTAGTITFSTIAQTVSPIIYVRGILAGNIIGLPKTGANTF